MKNIMTVELDPETGSIKYSKTVEFEGGLRVHSKYIPGADQKMFDELWAINKQLNEGIRRFENDQRKGM